MSGSKREEVVQGVAGEQGKAVGQGVVGVQRVAGLKREDVVQGVAGEQDNEV